MKNIIYKYIYLYIYIYLFIYLFMDLCHVQRKYLALIGVEYHVRGYS